MKLIGCIVVHWYHFCRNVFQEKSILKSEKKKKKKRKTFNLFLSHCFPNTFLLLFNILGVYKIFLNEVYYVIQAKAAFQQALLQSALLQSHDPSEIYFL